MIKLRLLFLIPLLGFSIVNTNAQTTSASNNLVAQPIPDRTVPFSVTDAGAAKPITWGLDLAWLSEENIRRGVAFMGSDRVDVVRSSFTPTAALVNGDLQAAQLSTLNQRLGIINSRLGSNTQVVLNCDHPSVDASFSGNAANWAQLIDVTTRRHQEAGRTVVTVSPFNEPDNTSTGQGTVTDFYNIAGLLKQNSRFTNIRISGGNTLNDDQALSWYNTLKDRLDEGNTHQLAGSFDNYATFQQTVRANGDYASNDELHNVMEAMVGVEYGLQTGIWWGTAELARGEFVKASDGVRLGYAEHRPNWTAASVYRTLDGKIQAFGGTSERQAVTTSYRFLSKDKDVFYDGYGPQREYIMALPGGTGYQTGQTNAERVVNITWGDDIQPAINGRYVLVNRNSGMVVEVAGGSTTAGAAVQQNANTGATYQQWDVTPVDSRIGGDYSYFTLAAAHSGKAIDVLNFSLENGGSIDAWDNIKNAAQQWYLDYAGDGWFYIRSRYSAKCLDVYNSSTAPAAGIVQWDKNGGTNQQWRLLPVGASIEFVAPGAPTNLVATANAESIRLSWTASAASDVAGYTIFRSESAGGPYYTIARNVTSTSFVDNTATTTGQHYYVVKAVDNSLNRSGYSNEASATSTGSNDIVTSLAFDGNTLDNSVNLNHSATYGGTSFVTGKVGTNAIALNGTNAFLQLPANVANQQAITIATWVYWNGGAVWQRIFDFGNDQNQYMFLTPSSGSGLRFAIKNGGSEQVLTATVLPTGVWSHVAVTLGSSGATMYVNGQQVAQSTAITIRPLDFKPVLNYIGRSQYADPLLNGNVDDFRIYNYALSAGEVNALAGIVSGATYLVTNVASGKCLDNLGVTTNGSNVAQWGASGSANQQWVITLSSGYYKMKCVTGNMYLDGVGHTADGSTVGEWASSSSTNQQWTITPVGSYFKIINRTNGKCLDTGGGTTDGSIMQFWGSGASSNQLWSLSRINTGSSRIATTDTETISTDITVYPNPVVDELFIQTDGVRKLSVDIYTITGEKILSEKTDKGSVSLKTLSAGMYFVKVEGDGYTVTKRIIKK
ncbi:MAG TPA: RICIN domain-containing protein [Cyclobacteriaceae bacterium]